MAAIVNGKLGGVKAAVVGAGLAGLRAAVGLEAQGHEVTVFEARERIGGRVHTGPSGFETGAEWIDEEHERLRALLRDLDIDEVAAPTGEYLLHCGGSRARQSEPWEEASQDMAAFAGAVGRLEPPFEGTVSDVIERATRSSRGRWLVNANVRTDEGEEPARIGLAPWLEFRRFYEQREGSEASAYRLGRGGSDLVRRLAGRVDGEIRLSCRLIGVSSEVGVRLDFGRFAEQFDLAVLAVPQPCLRDIQFDTPPANLEACLRLRQASTIKARFRFERPFWLDEGWEGYLKSDTPIQQTWPDRVDPQCLVGYICGDDARALHDSGDIAGALARHWREFCGEAPEIEVYDWIADEFAQGAFAFAPPGAVLADLRRRDSGPVQLAGEFCGAWFGFMEGALDSADSALESLR